MSKPTYASKDEVQAIVRDAVSEIAGLITDIIEKIDSRFNSVEATLAEHTVIFKEFDARLARVEYTLGTVTTRIDRLEPAVFGTPHDS